MIIFIIKRNEKEELLKIKEVPFVISREKGDFTDVSLSENHLIVLGYNEKEVFLKANSKVVYNEKEIIGEFKLKEGESFKAGEIEFQLAKIEFVVSKEEILAKSQPTQFIDIEKTEVPYLKIISGSDAGKIIEIEKTGIIGRGEEADYKIDDQFVSRKQAKIYVFDDKYEIEDIGGKNPTLVNGKVITKITPLHSGDEILIGKTRILFVNPKEKPETEIYKSKGVPVYVYGILSLIFIIIIALGIWFFRVQQENRYNNLINSVSSTIPLVAQLELTESKVNALERAKNEILQAEKIKKNDQKINELKPIVEKHLSAWKDVQKAETEIKNENYLSALSYLENAIKILQEDRYVNSLYDKVLITTLIQQNYSEAKTLFEQGKVKEALDVLNLALSRVPDHPQLLELRNIILTSQRKKTTPKEIETKLATLKEIKPKVEKKEEKTKVEEQKTSLESKIKVEVPNISLIDLEKTIVPEISLEITLDETKNLINAYEKEHNLDKTIRIATSILQNDPNNVKAKYYLRLAQKEKQAIAYERQGKKQEAIAIWEEILKLDPGNSWAKQALSRLGK
ncbi:MAG: FHA domain-containing protein [candidate division WOR-3 bacterium]|nr:FHA domain-containing protein [candidate division WOR-3 bacterium]MDW8150379.1 FHA domain-containing protein [candidate division WOR-3 bacterium]